MQTAYFGAGCFWGVQALFDELIGVTETYVGYMGGHTQNPTYKDICTDRTGHAEVVKVVYDSTAITYDELLTAFFKMHNPTLLNRQGPDVGSQYRSVIFTTSPEQEQQAKTHIEALTKAKAYGEKRIVTQVATASTYYDAEEYHQHYFKKRGMAPTCHL